MQQQVPETHVLCHWLKEKNDMPCHLRHLLSVPLSQAFRVVLKQTKRQTSSPGTKSCGHRLALGHALIAWH